MTSILRITDGTNTVSLLDVKRGFLLSEWIPSIAPFKNSGVWSSSPLIDGKRLAMRNFDNAIETFELKLHGHDQDTAIQYIQDLVTLLEKAVAYWTTDWQDEPVWIEACGAKESNIRYALIKSYTIDGLGNPYKQPFFGLCDETVIDDFTLLIERDHWLDHYPGSSHAVEVSSLQYFSGGTTTVHGTYDLAASADDANITIYLPHTVSLTAANYLGIDNADGWHHECGLSFPSVTIPQGADILDAYIEVESTATDTEDIAFTIVGEKNGGAQWISGVDGYTDYFIRKEANHTEAGTTHTPARWAPNIHYYITGLTDIVQEIVDQNDSGHAWASGDRVNFFIGFYYPSSAPAPTAFHRSFGSFDLSPTYSIPRLHVFYVSAGKNMGHNVATTENVYIANKHTLAQLSRIYVYDTGEVAPWSANYLGTALPWTLLPATPANNDVIYFGSVSNNDEGPFDSIALDLSTASDDLTLTWYYPTSIGPPIVWTALPYVEGNKDMSLTGDTVVFWKQPSDWVEVAAAPAAPYTGWWVKAVVSGVGGAPVAPVQHNEEIYSIITPFLDIDAAQIPGEIPALARIKLQGYARNFPVKCVVVGARSKSRGEYFSPYINFSFTQQFPGISPYGGTSPSTDTTAPMGESVTQAIAATSTLWAMAGGMELDSFMSRQYIGSYHAYLRMTIDDSPHYGELRLRLKVESYTHANKVYSREVYPQKPTHEPCVVDFGIISIGNRIAMASGEYTESTALIVEFWNDDANTFNLKLFDLILIPVDEWAGMYYLGTGMNINIGYDTFVDIDPLKVPKYSRALLRRVNTGAVDNELIIAELVRAARGGPLLQANADQRLWFFSSMGDDSDFQTKFGGRVWRNSRYLTMRGAS